MKLRTSPKTNIFVSQLRQIIEYSSAWRKTRRHPRMMYIDAEKKAGAMSSVRVCMIYGPRFRGSCDGRMRPMYPTASTTQNFINNCSVEVIFKLT